MLKQVKKGSLSLDGQHGIYRGVVEFLRDLLGVPISIGKDKIVQRAVAAVLNEIYEAEFLGFSYGFRPERGQHDALDALYVGICSKKVSFILDADIRSFFTEVSQEWVVRFLEHRIGDKRILRLIQKWLRAGVLEDEVVTIEETGMRCARGCGRFR